MDSSSFHCEVPTAALSHAAESHLSGQELELSLYTHCKKPANVCGTSALFEVQHLAHIERGLSVAENILYISQLITWENNFKALVYPFPQKHAAICYTYLVLKDTACDNTGNHARASF